MSDDEFIARGGNGDAGARVAFDYIKSQSFRVIRADGVIGSVTPNGSIHMAFFSERPAIPRRVVNKISPDGKLGDEIEHEKVSRDSVVREMDVDLFVNLRTARSVHKWLGERIAEAEQRLRERQEKEGGES